MAGRRQSRWRATPLAALLCLSYPQRSYLKITGLASGSALYGARDFGGA